MADWTVLATVLAVGTGLTILTTYIVYKAQIEKTRNRILALEREIAKARIREEINQKSSRKFLRRSNCARRPTTSSLNSGKRWISSSPRALCKKTDPPLR